MSAHLRVCVIGSLCGQVRTRAQVHEGLPSELVDREWPTSRSMLRRCICCSRDFSLPRRIAFSLWR